MEIRTNRNTLTPSSQQSFKAQLKGPAVYEAINRARNASELAELKEIVDNVSLYGDKATEIFLEKTGLVKVSNKKMSNVLHKFNYKLNENSENKYLDMVKNFNTTNCIIRCEEGLIGEAFAHSRNKKGLYEMYKNYNFSPTTKHILDHVAGKLGIIETCGLNPKLDDLNVLKKMFFPEYFKK